MFDKDTLSLTVVPPEVDSSDGSILDVSAVYSMTYESSLIVTTD